MSIDKKQRWIWYLILIQALLAMGGSLFYSNFGDPVANLSQGYLFAKGFDPCHLCWWARILMYPIVAISIVGIIRKDRFFTNYILPLSIPGIFLDSYHYLLQKVHTGLPVPCSIDNPCSASEVNYLGFITIPFLALTAFVVITVLCVINWRINKKSPA